VLVAALGLVGAGILMLILGFFLTITGPDFSLSRSRRVAGAGLWITTLVMAVVASLVGQRDCTAVPRRAGARRLAVLGLTLYSISLVLFLMRLGLPVVFGSMHPFVAPEPVVYGARTLTVLGFLFAAVRWYVWISFLRTVARLTAPRLARNLSNLLITAEIIGILVLISAALMNFPHDLLRGSSPLLPSFDALRVVGGFLGCITTVPFLVVVVWTVVATFEVRAAIAAYIAGR
jgi:hypothetical protein